MPHHPNANSGSGARGAVDLEKALCKGNPHIANGCDQLRARHRLGKFHYPVHVPEMASAFIFKLHAAGLANPLKKNSGRPAGDLRV